MELITLCQSSIWVQKEGNLTFQLVPWWCARGHSTNRKWLFRCKCRGLYGETSRLWRCLDVDNDLLRWTGLVPWLHWTAKFVPPFFFFLDQRWFLFFSKGTCICILWLNEMSSFAHSYTAEERLWSSVQINARCLVSSWPARLNVNLWKLILCILLKLTAVSFYPVQPM